MEQREWTRRAWIKASFAAAAAGCLLGRASTTFADVTGMTLGVQLYMLREQAKSDLRGVFRAIHDAGFAQVELYPIAYTHSAADIRRMVADAGLGAVAGHFDYAGLEGKLDFAQQLGLKYVVCPMIPREQWGTLAGFAQAAELFSRVGEQLRSRGMEFVFHNHDYEFRPIEGSTGFAALMQHTDPTLVKLEFDLYWLTQAGQDPLAMMKAHADRLRLVHLKDRTANAVVSFTPSAPQYFTELGHGTLAWPALLAQAQKQGVRYAFVDQDETALPIPQSLAVNRAYLRGLQL